VRERVQRNLSVEPKESNLKNTLKQSRYLGASVIALILSACLPGLEKQLLVISMIAGIKWVADGIDKRINIFIKCGLRREGG
jgi:hypothetical protein